MLTAREKAAPGDPGPAPTIRLSRQRASKSVRGPILGEFLMSKTTSQNQLFLSLERPGDFKYSKKSQIMKTSYFWKSQLFGNRNAWYLLQKMGHAQILVNLGKSRNLSKSWIFLEYPLLLNIPTHTLHQTISSGLLRSRETLVDQIFFFKIN